MLKRTSTMLTEIIGEDWAHISVTQRHGRQGTEEGRHTDYPADELEAKPQT